MKFFVPGKPIAQPRPRFRTRIIGKWHDFDRALRGKGWVGALMRLVTAGTYEAPKAHPIHNWKHAIRHRFSFALYRVNDGTQQIWNGDEWLNITTADVIQACREFRRPKKIEKPTPIAVSIGLVTTRPQRLIWSTKPMPRQWDVRAGAGYGDCDNYAKAILDALTGLAWDDDGQVVRLSVSKVIAAAEEDTGAYISVSEASPIC